jgi:hypothetical protein
MPIGARRFPAGVDLAHPTRFKSLTFGFDTLTSEIGGAGVRQVSQSLRALLIE